MLETTLAFVIIRSLPESILFILAGYIFLRLKIDRKKIFLNGIILGIIVSFIRVLPISYGIHTVLSMIVGGCILSRIAEKTMIELIMATCGIFISLGISEAVYIGIVSNIIGIPMDVLMRRDAVGAMLSMPSLVIFIIVAFIISKLVDKVKVKVKSEVE